MLTNITIKKKTRSTAFMESGTFSHIIHGKIHAMFNAVDTFMFCTMVHINTPDILHQR